MRPGTTPHVVSEIKPFLGTNYLGAPLQRDVSSAGVSKDGKVVWVVRESILEVIDAKSGQCVSSWKFGETICDTHTYITCVKEYQYGSTRKLLVGICNSSHYGMLCVFDVSYSKVIKAVEIPHKISAVDVVTNVGGDHIPMWALNAQLRHFYGIVAVGTNGGIVYLLDMCLEDDVESDEIKPNKVQFLSPRSRDTEQRRVQAMSKSQQLCMVLDEEAQGNGFMYRRCDGTVMKTFESDAVHISCLHYIKQIGSLFVGFSFGCYQIWKLHAPVLEYSSRLETDMTPITHIAYQEPENDPKNFSYIWITRSTEDHQDDNLSSIALYQLAYNKKTWYSNYGAFYEELTSVSLRFDLELVASPLNPSLKSTVSSRLISCYTLEDLCYKPPAKLDDDESFEESLHGPDLSLSVFVWDCYDGSSHTAHMGIFDMNRWYHAQMPATVRSMTGVMDTCSYFSFLSLDEVADQSELGSILAVFVSVDNLGRFTNTSPMPPEQHFYPAALAFNALAVVDDGLVTAQYLGTQRQVMATMQKMGPSVLINPKELHNLCIIVGLLPRPLDAASHNPSPGQMKESLLSMALDYHLLSFLLQCVQEWASGEYVHVGCTLKFLLDWAWAKVAQIKNNIDNTCTTLYDWSGIPLDKRGVQTLYQSNQRLVNLITIIKALINQSAPTTEEGLEELQNKLSVVTFIQQHLQMVMWFYNMGLLPEHDEQAEFQDHQYSYPAHNLGQSYKQRRQEIQRLDSSVEPTGILIIDGMMEEMGDKIKELWSADGGNGMYPPQSLHSLLSIYLLDGISLMDKHSLVLYTLLDMVSLASQTSHSQCVESVSKFNQKFGIPISVFKQIKGFWLLDHRDFEESMSFILDPSVRLELGRWQHQRVLKSLIYQGGSKMAARYIATIQPSLSAPEEVKLRLTVLLINGLTGEALEYQRKCRDQCNANDLLQHLFHACQQTKTVDQLLQLPMTSQEEETMMDFLSQSSDPYCQEVLIFHFLQRARYVEAIRLNEKLKQSAMIDASAKARERATARNAIVDGFMSILTEVQRKLVWENYHCPKKPIASRREVKRPQPLSTTLTKKHHNIHSRSSMYVDVMSHIQDMEQDQLESPERGEDIRGSTNMLFGTPITPRTRDTVGNHSVIYPDIGKATTPTPNAPGQMTPIRTKLKVHGASALRLLQTPKVERKTPRKNMSMYTSTMPTPQSILKIRNLLNSSTCSTSQSESQETSVKADIPTSKMSLGKKLGFNDTTVAASPRSVSFVEKTSDLTRPLLTDSEQTQGTPKKLRFIDDKMEEESHQVDVSSREPLRSPRKQLKINTADATILSPKMSSPKFPSSPKSRAPRSPLTPKSVKHRSPTPENISKSPKNRSKLDRLSGSSRKTSTDEPVEISQEPPREAESTMDVEHPQGVDSQHVDLPADVEMDDEGKEVMQPPILQQAYEINSTSLNDVEVPSPSSSQNDDEPPVLVPTYSKGRFTQLRDSPIKSSPKKLLSGGMTRSPTVKLTKSINRTPLFGESSEPLFGESSESKKVSVEESSTKMESTEPVEIDLTKDEDISDEIEEPQKNKLDSVETVVTETLKKPGMMPFEFKINASTVTQITAADSSEDNVTTSLSSATSSNIEDDSQVKKKDFSRIKKKYNYTFSLPEERPSPNVVQEKQFMSPDTGEDIKKGNVAHRHRHHFTFSLPAQVDSPGLKDGNQSCNVNVSDEKTEPDSTSEDKTLLGNNSKEEESQFFEKLNVKRDEEAPSPRRSQRIYNSLSGPDDTVNVVTPFSPRRSSRVLYNSLVGGENDIRIEIPKVRKASLKAHKFKYTLKSPPSAKRAMRQNSSKSEVKKRDKIEKRTSSRQRKQSESEVNSGKEKLNKSLTCELEQQRSTVINQRLSAKTSERISTRSHKISENEANLSEDIGSLTSTIEKQRAEVTGIRSGTRKLEQQRTEVIDMRSSTKKLRNLSISEENNTNQKVHEITSARKSKIKTRLDSSAEKSNNKSIELGENEGKHVKKDGSAMDITDMETSDKFVFKKTPGRSRKKGREQYSEELLVNDDKSSPVTRSKSPSKLEKTVDKSSPVTRSKSPSKLDKTVDKSSPVTRSKSPSKLDETVDKSSPVTRSKSPSKLDKTVDKSSPVTRSKSPSKLDETVDKSSPVTRSKSPSKLDKTVDRSSRITRSKSPSKLEKRVDRLSRATRSKSPSKLDKTVDRSSRATRSKSPSKQEKTVDRSCHATRSKSPSKSEKAKLKSPSKLEKTVNKSSPITRSKSPSKVEKISDGDVPVTRSKSPLKIQKSADKTSPAGTKSRSSRSTKKVKSKSHISKSPSVTDTSRSRSRSSEKIKDIGADTNISVHYTRSKDKVKGSHSPEYVSKFTTPSKHSTRKKKEEQGVSTTKSSRRKDESILVESKAAPVHATRSRSIKQSDDLDTVSLTPTRRSRKKLAVKEEVTEGKAQVEKESEKPADKLNADDKESEPVKENEVNTNEDNKLVNADIEDQEKENDTQPFQFSEPVEMETSADGLEDEAFEPARSFVFSPPLTRLSKRLSMEPDKRSSLTGRLSLQPESLSRPAQKRLSKTLETNTEEGFLLPTVNVTPRPPIHDKDDTVVKRSLRTRSQTPEVQSETIRVTTRRGASAPPENPPKEKLRKKRTRRKANSPKDEVIPIIDEEKVEEGETEEARKLKEMQEQLQEADKITSQKLRRPQRKKSYKLW